MLGRDRPEPGGLYAAGRNGRRAHRSAAAWSSARVSFATAVRTFSMQWAPLRGPTHLLVVAHPTVQQPLHRALRGRRRDRLVAALCRRIIDDQVRLPGDVGLEPSQQRRCLRRGRQCRLRHALKRGQCLPDRDRRHAAPDRARGASGCARPHRPAASCPRARPAYQRAIPWPPAPRAGCAWRDETSPVRGRLDQCMPPLRASAGHQRRRSGWSPACSASRQGDAAHPAVAVAAGSPRPARC